MSQCRMSQYLISCNVTMCEVASLANVSLFGGLPHVTPYVVPYSVPVQVKASAKEGNFLRRGGASVF
jgi:hypothetical protein